MMIISDHRHLSGTIKYSDIVVPERELSSRHKCQVSIMMADIGCKQVMISDRYRSVCQWHPYAQFESVRFVCFIKANKQKPQKRRNAAAGKQAYQLRRRLLQRVSISIDRSSSVARHFLGRRPVKLNT